MMTPITINQVEDFCTSLPVTSGIYADIYGYVIRIEERIDKGLHLGKSLRVHPGTDTLENALKDVLAIAKDFGITILKN